MHEAPLVIEAHIRDNGGTAYKSGPGQDGQVGQDKDKSRRTKLDQTSLKDLREIGRTLGEVSEAQEFRIHQLRSRSRRAEVTVPRQWVTGHPYRPPGMA